MSAPGTGEDTASSPGIVLPVGYQAAHVPGSATTPPRLRIRIGTEYVQLEGRSDVGMWLLAHGSWGVRRTGWSRADVLAAAAERELEDPAATLDRMTSSGLIACADTEAEQQWLASRYRLCPLMYCMGDIGDGVALMVADPKTTRVRLEPRELAVWLFTPPATTIWQSAIDGADDGTMDVFHPFRSPGELLGGILRCAQFLVSRGGAYVDVPVRAVTRVESFGD